MITHKQGDVLRVKVGIILHGCNAQGVMGSGVARQLRDVYPDIYTEYLAHLSKFKSARDALGSVNIVQVTDKLFVGNLITQEYYGREPGKRYVSYDAIAECFASKHLVNNFETVNIPYLIGAGLGGGSEAVIRSIIDTSAIKNINYFYLN